MSAETIQLNDGQKVAILLASMDEKLAAQIIQQLAPDVMAQVANAIRRLGVVSGEERRTAIADALAGILSMGNTVHGDETLVNSLLIKAVGEKRASAILQERGTEHREAFSSIKAASADQIVAILNSEQPSVIGAVIKHLSSTVAGEVLQMLPSDVRRKTIIYLCKANTPSPEVLESIDKYVESKIVVQSRKVNKVDSGDRVDVLTTLLQHVDRSVEEELLAAIEDTSEKLANHIKDRLFTFEDIVKLNDPAIRRIMQEVDTAILSVALRNASVNLKQKFFSNMSKRAVETIKEEMEFASKIKRSEVEAKQREVVAVIRSLETDGQISIGTGKDDDYV